MARGGVRPAVWWAAALLLVLGGLLWLRADVARAATTRFVAITGSDNGGTNNCANQASPCRTVQNAVNHAAGGDTIQIGPGVYLESVTSMAKGLTFSGAGSGTSKSFDPATDTAIDAAGTTLPAFTLGPRNETFQNIRIRGGFDPSNGGDVKPAITMAGIGSTTLTIKSSILAQFSAFQNPTGKEYALTAGGTRVSIQSSLVAGFENGVRASGNGGSLTIENSSILTPTPANPGISAGIRAGVTSFEPTLISDSTITGIAGFADEDTSATIVRSFIGASGGGVVLLDNGGGGSVAVRDSVVDVVGNPAPFGALGVGVSAQNQNESTVPTLSLIGDTVLARSPHVPTALSLADAAAGTKVNVHNTILHAIDTSGGNANNDIRTGSQAIVWNVGFSDYAEVAGPGVPAPGAGTNINAPPHFVNDDGSNLRLSGSSTLFDKGDPTIVGANETDVTGAPRSVPHTCGSPALPDLGAFEAAPPPCPLPPPVPSLSQFSQSHKKWRTGSQAAALTASKHKKHKKHKKKAPVGTTFRFTLNTPSSVTLTFTESTKGRKGKGGKCVAQTKHNKHKRSCKRTIPAGTLTFPNAAAGTDSISFAGKIPNHRKLKAGKYTVTLEATNSSGHSTTSSLRFTIVRR